MSQGLLISLQCKLSSQYLKHMQLLLFYQCHFNFLKSEASF